jgi:prepilin-type N-terminal cleavage/methylation domain-containing protein
MKKNNKGFTLIELLIVIAVIAILAALAIPNLIGSRKAANETSAIAQLRTIVTSEESLKARNLLGTNFYGLLSDLETNKLVTWPTTGTYTKSGYTFADVGAPTATSWAVSGLPSSTNDGDRNFAATMDGFVRASASTNPVAASAAAIQADANYKVIQ